MPGTLPPVVEAIGELHFEGDVIPHTWYQHPLLRFHADKTRRGEAKKGKKKLKQADDDEMGDANLLAINILADIIYWYRPYTVIDEASGRVIERRKKFADDKYQRSYDGWAKKYGQKHDRKVREAALWLRKRGLITIEYRDVTLTSGSILRNVTYFEPVPEKIKTLNEIQPVETPRKGGVPTGGDTSKGVSPSAETPSKGIATGGDTSPHGASDDLPPGATRLTLGGEYTENTAETTSETTTDTFFVAEPAATQGQEKIATEKNGLHPTCVDEAIAGSARDLEAEADQLLEQAISLTGPMPNRAAQREASLWLVSNSYNITQCVLCLKWLLSDTKRYKPSLLLVKEEIGAFVYRYSKGLINVDDGQLPDQTANTATAFPVKLSAEDLNIYTSTVVDLLRSGKSIEEVADQYAQILQPDDWRLIRDEALRQAGDFLTVSNSDGAATAATA